MITYVMPPEVIVLTSTVSYSRRHCRLCDFENLNLVIQLFTILIALPPDQFLNFGSRSLSTTCYSYSMVFIKGTCVQPFLCSLLVRNLRTLKSGC